MKQNELHPLGAILGVGSRLYLHHKPGLPSTQQDTKPSGVSGLLDELFPSPWEAGGAALSYLRDQQQETHYWPNAADFFLVHL